MKNETRKYEEALAQLERLAQQMEHGEVPIDEMAERLKEGQRLLQACRQQLYAADEAVRGILNAAEEDSPRP